MLNAAMVERINNLPPLPKTVQEIERALADANVNAKKIAAIIEEDPMVVADLLKLLNSAFYGLRKEISNVEQAVALLGMSNVKDLAVNLSLRNMLRTNLSPYGITPEEFAKISQFQSLLAQSLMRDIAPKEANTIRLQALLQEIGKIVMSDEVIREGEERQFKADIEAGWNIREVEKNYLQTTTAEVSAMMLKRWDFDESFYNAILWSDRPNQADPDIRDDAWVLRIAAEAVSVRAPLHENSCNKAINIAIKGGYPDEKVKTITQELASKWSA